MPTVAVRVSTAVARIVEGRGRKVFCSVVFTLVTLWAPGKLVEKAR